MAERRMFAKTIVLSDAFLDMPMSARCLYFTLGMLADDDGFINSPKSIMRQCGASQDDMLILLDKRFILPFESGVIVIKHWRINNYLQKDRYHPTVYGEERAQLDVDEKGAYTESESKQIADHVYTSMYTQDRLGKDRLGKDSKEREAETPKRFTPPAPEDVRAYCKEKGYNIDPEQFCDFYASKGWKVGNQPMKDWRAAVRTWVKRHKAESSSNEGRSYTLDPEELRRRQGQSDFVTVEGDDLPF